MAGTSFDNPLWFSSPNSATADSNVDNGRRRDDASLMHFSTNSNRPMATSGQNAAISGKSQFTICYKGTICLYDGIPAEKVREIMLIAATAAKSAEVKSRIHFPSLIPTTPSSQGTSSNLASPQSVCFPADKKPICRLQDEFPLARRQSLQRFLEKRQDRLVSKAPYAFSTKNAGDNIGNNFYDNNTSYFASLNDQRNDFNPLLLSLQDN